MQGSDNFVSIYLQQIIDETKQNDILTYEIAPKITLNSLFESIVPSLFDKTLLNKYIDFSIDDDFNIKFNDIPTQVVLPSPLDVKDFDINLEINFDHNEPNKIFDDDKEPQEAQVLGKPASLFSIHDITSGLVTQTATENIIQENFQRVSRLSTQNNFNYDDPNKLNNSSIIDNTGISDILQMAMRSSGLALSRETRNKLRNSRLSNHPTIKTPLEFIRLLERTYYIGTSAVKYDLEPLKQYQEKSILSINILQIEEKQQLCKILKSMEDDRNTFFIDYENSFLYKGGNNGIIHKFSITEQKEVESIDTKNKNSILCIDIRDKFIACGYSNGSIVIIEDNKIAEIKEQYHKSSVINIKIIKTINKDNVHEMITSDMDGNVFYLKYKKSFIGSKFEKELEIMKNLSSPVYLVDSYYFGKDKQIIDIKKDSKRKDIYSLLILVSLEVIVIYQLNPELKKVFTYNKPPILPKENLIQDVAIGMGYIPISKQQAKIRDSMDMTIKTDFSAELTLFAISWGNTVKIFNPVISIGHTTQISLCAHYIHNKPILRIGFLSRNYLYIVDNTFILKIFDTKTFEYGDLGSDNIPTILSEKIVINEYSLKACNIYSQNFLYDKKANIKRETFSASIGNIKRGIIVLGSNQIIICKANNLESVINELDEKKEYEKLLSFCLEIFQQKNRITTLLVSNEKTNEEIDKFLEQKKETYVNDFLIKYVTYICTQKSQSDVEHSIKTFIEFCYKIEMMRFLFEDLFNYFKVYGLYGKFFDCLEGYILTDRLKYTNEMTEDVVYEMIEYYMAEKKGYSLSKMLLHLSPDVLTPIKVRQSIQEHDLVNAFIYLSMNAKDFDQNVENYFKPIEYLFSFFMNKEPNLKYTTFIMTKDEDLYSDDIIKSKQYFGHRLLWYCSFCLNGDKYPDKIPFEKELYNDIVIKIYLWMISEIALRELLSFDSFSFFEVFSRFYLEEDIYTKISINYTEHPNYWTFIDKVALEYEPDKITPVNVLTNIINFCKKMEDNFYILKDLYDFIAKLFAKPNKLEVIPLERSLFLEAIEFFLSYEQKKNNSAVDPFLCHFNLDEEKIYKILEKDEQKILKLIEIMDPQLTKDELNELLKYASTCPYNQVKIELYDQLNDYPKAFDAQMKKFNEENDIPLNAKVAILFGWINETFINLNNSRDVENLTKIKEHILEQLIPLSKVSIPNVILLVKEYFNSQQEAVIESLNGDKALQYDFLKRFLGITSKENPDDDLVTINNFIVNDEDNDAPDEAMSQKMEKFYTLFIELACKQGEKDYIFKILQQKRCLCNDQILQILTDNHVYEPAVYIHQILGGYNEGLELGTKGIFDIYEQITKNLFGNQFSEIKNKLLLRRIENIVNLCIIICQTVSEATNLEDTIKETWDILLSCLYKIKLKFNLLMEKKNLPELRYECGLVQKGISNALETTLEKMSSHVQINDILELVSEKYPEAGHKECMMVTWHLFFSLTQNKYLFQKTLEIMEKQMKKFFNKLVDLSHRGKYFNLEIPTCLYCLKSLDDNQDEKGVPTVLFECGHIYHAECCATENYAFVCYFCRKEEIERSIGNIENKLEPAPKPEEKVDEEEEVPKEKEPEKPKNNYKRKRMKRKIENFNKKYFEKSALVDYLP